MDDIAKIETQLERSMIVIAGLAAAAILPLAGLRPFFGFAVGATLAVVGYRWLARAVAAALQANEKPAPSGIVRNLVLRYVLAIGAILVSWQTHWLPIRWMSLGFLVPAAGAMAESLLLLGKMLHAPSGG